MVNRHSAILVKLDVLSSLMYYQGWISYRYKPSEGIFHVSNLFRDLGNDYNTSKLRDSNYAGVHEYFSSKNIHKELF